MKVLLIHNFGRNTSGVDRRFHAARRILRRHGLDVASFCVHTRDLGDGPGGAVRKLLEGVYSLPAYRAVAAAVRRERPDVAHALNLLPALSPSVLVACRRQGVPVVKTWHDYGFSCASHFHFSGGTICERCSPHLPLQCVLRNCWGRRRDSAAAALRSAVSHALRLYSRNITLSVCATRFVRQRLVQSGVPRGRTVVSRYPYLLRGSDREPQGRYAAYVGRMSPEKGVDTLLQAAWALPAVPVRLAGTGPALQRLRAAAPPNAQFTGRLHDTTLDALYGGARFAVVPSKWYEVTPCVIVEAMSCGLPVIASRVGDLPNQIRDGVTGLLFEPGDAAGLADRMRVLWEDHRLRRELGESARAEVRREYSDQACYSRLTSVYSKAIELGTVEAGHGE
jgi:glycosyltransferase involved in cell wall biosynthesis